MDTATATTVAPAPAAPKQKLLKRAVLYGIAVDLGITFGFALLAVLIYRVVVGNGFFADMSLEVDTNPILGKLAIAVGVIGSITGGYVAAYAGKTRPYAHALWAAGVLSVFLLFAGGTGLVGMLGKTLELEFWYTFTLMFSSLLVPFLYIAGARLAEKVLASEAAKVPPVPPAEVTENTINTISV